MDSQPTANTWDVTLTIQDLWRAARFTPNPRQEEAILHVKGPLYLTAGPGSGKTRTLLWRTLNLIAFQGVPPEAIFLSTFTEKAAHQLKEGIQALLGHVTNLTGRPFDLAPMYVGTVHSLCRRILSDRRFTSRRERARPPHLLDELDQYFHLYRPRTWRALTDSDEDTEPDANRAIISFFSPDWDSQSRHNAVNECIALFNRLSEECIDPQVAIQHCLDDDPDVQDYLDCHNISQDGLRRLLDLYDRYRQSLDLDGGLQLTDFALLQQTAHRVLQEFDSAGQIFQHVIVDEYQDTNTIQERLFFALAAGHQNLCVVGDDDQALYRFRGATVENFVEFPARCQDHFQVEPRHIPLERNYRSRRRIVDFYSDFMNKCDWMRPAGGHFRVLPKNLTAHRQDPHPSVVASTPGHPDDVCAEIAALVRSLLDEGLVQDPNQVAFLFPSVQYRGEPTTQLVRMRAALEDQGLLTYAPRAGRFLDVAEAVDVLGLLSRILGSPPLRTQVRGTYGQFCTYLRDARTRADTLIADDPHLSLFVDDRQAEIGTVVSDFQALSRVVERNRWTRDQPYDPARMKRALLGARGLSDAARSTLSSVHLDRIVARYREQGRPMPLRTVIGRAASLDWSVLDLFYRLCGFDHFSRMFDLAQSGGDEGPICNLALVSQYLARFTEQYWNVITGEILADNTFVNTFFMSYLLALYRLGESEYEDADDPFPRGRIPFLTIHQAKGLEFPVVVLANPRKRDWGPQRVETIVRPLLERDEGEPLDRLSEFDTMRMWYVALSRAKNLLVIAHWKSQGNYVNEPFRTMLDDHFPRIPDLDLSTIPPAEPDRDRLPRGYSYTGDFLKYRQCPREYMIFHKYGFEPSRTETAFFGTLVHQTLEDLHNLLIARRNNHE